LHYGRFRHHGTPERVSTEPGAPLAFVHQHVDYDGEGCLLWPFAWSGPGYGAIRKGNKRIAAHRLMCELAHGKPPKGAQAAHSCGNPQCVHPKHLRWASIKENMHDKWKHGTIVRGERVPTNKLTEAQVLAILADDRGQRVIARELGVSQSAVGFALTGRTWSWLTGRNHPDKVAT